MQQWLHVGYFALSRGACSGCNTKPTTHLSWFQELWGNAGMWWSHTNTLGKLRKTLKWVWVCICRKKAVSWQSALKAHLSNICAVLQINNLCRLGIWGIEILEFWNFRILPCPFYMKKTIVIISDFLKLRKQKSNIFPVLKQFQTSWVFKIFPFLFHWAFPL